KERVHQRCQYEIRQVVVPVGQERLGGVHESFPAAGQDGGCVGDRQGNVDTKPPPTVRSRESGNLGPLAQSAASGSPLSRGRTAEMGGTDSTSLGRAVVLPKHESPERNGAP